MIKLYDLVRSVAKEMEADGYIMAEEQVAEFLSRCDDLYCYEGPQDLQDIPVSDMTEVDTDYLPLTDEEIEQERILSESGNKEDFEPADFIGVTNEDR